MTPDTPGVEFVTRTSLEHTGVRLFLATLFLLLPACSRGEPTSSAPTPSTSLEPAPQPAQLAASLLATADARATVAPRETQTQAMLATRQGEAAQAATSNALVQATAYARPMLEVLQTLVVAGTVSRPDGEYHNLPDFGANLAQINHYDYLLSEFAPADFVVRSQVEWLSASETSNWSSSGCGYVFRLNARGDHYLAFLALDGRFYLYRNLKETIQSVGSWYYGEVGRPQGKAELMLAVEGARISFFVDGHRVHTQEDNTLSSGYLGFAVVSGTNRPSGMDCQMTDLELWILKPG